MVYNEQEIRSILSEMIDTREICGNHEGEEYTIALMEITDDSLMCWQNDVGDFSVALEDFVGCSSQDSLEEMIWQAFLQELKLIDEEDRQCMECPRCRYIWITRVAHPKKCPRCQFKL